MAAGSCSSTACGGSWASSPFSSLPQPAPKPPPLERPPPAPSGAPFCSLLSTRSLKAPPGTALPSSFRHPLGCSEAAERTQSQPYPHEAVPGRTGDSWTQSRAVSGPQTMRRWEREWVSLPSDVWRQRRTEAGTRAYPHAHTGLAQSSSLTK